MAINNEMKYHPFQKNKWYTSSIVLVKLSYIFVVPFVVAFLTMVPVLFIKTAQVNAVFTFYTTVIAEIATIIFLIWDARRLKGVFLFDEYMEIVPSVAFYAPTVRKFKNVNYRDISYVDYVGSFRSDEDARYSGKYNVRYNFFGGNSADCIKIVLNNGLCGFVSAENSVELMTDIRDRMVAVGNENGYATQETVYMQEEVEINTDEYAFNQKKKKVILQNCVGSIVLTLLPIVLSFFDKNVNTSDMQYLLYPSIGIIYPILMLAGKQSKKPTRKKIYTSKEHYIAMAITLLINIAIYIVYILVIKGIIVLS